MLLLFPAAYLAEKQLFKPIKAALILMVAVLVLGVVEIKTGIVPLNFDEQSKTTVNYGDSDITKSIYGWRSIKDDFQEIRQQSIDEGMMKAEDGMIGLTWFPMANFDYYVAYPLGINMYGIRDITEIHKYTWINEYRGGLQKGADYWFLDESSDYYAPGRYIEPLFKEVIPCDTIVVERCGKPVKYVFVYMCKGLK